MLSVQTSIYNCQTCPACGQRKLIITEINDVVFGPNEDYIQPVKANITGICECTNCKVVYKLKGEAVLT